MTRKFNGLDRRDFLKRGSAAALAGGAMGGIPTQLLAASSKLNWLTWENYTQGYYMDPFREKTGHDFNFGQISNDDELLAKMMAGGTRDWDIITPGLNTIPIYIENQLLSPLNLDNIPNAARVLEPFKKVGWNKDADGNVYALPMAWGINAVAYRTDKMEHPDSWSAFFDDRYEGKIALWDYAVESIVVAALHVGISPDRLWVMDDKELAECKKALMAQKKLVRTYWSSLSDVTNLLASGEIWMAYSWVPPVYQLQEQGMPIGLAIPKEGAVGWADNNCVTAGVTDPEKMAACEAFINYILSEDFIETLAVKGPYAGGADTAMDVLTDEQKQRVFLDDLSVMDTFLWRQQPTGYDRWVKIWDEVKAS